jgi:hypothetical protein
VSAVLDNVAVSVPRLGDRFGLSSRTASGIEKNEHSETRDLTTDKGAVCRYSLASVNVFREDSLRQQAEAQKSIPNSVLAALESASFSYLVMYFADNVPANCWPTGCKMRLFECN